MMRRDGSSTFSEAFCTTEKTWTFDSTLLLLAPCGRSQKQQPKLFFSDRQYVQLICVGRPAIMEAFCRAQKKTSRDSYSSFSLRTLATVQKECSLHCKNVFLRHFSWSWRHCQLGRHFAGHTRTLANAVSTEKVSFFRFFPQLCRQGGTGRSRA